jgi:hypothetical protein
MKIMPIDKFRRSEDDVVSKTPSASTNIGVTMSQKNTFLDEMGVIPLLVI